MTSLELMALKQHEKIIKKKRKRKT